MIPLAETQAYLREQRIDAWLIYDFRGNNPVLAQLLPGQRWTTRRALLFIPASGEPRLAAHFIDAPQFSSAGVPRDIYLSWRELQEWLVRTLAGAPRVAMEYAPGAALPAVSIVDAGTVELIRALGVEVVSSANLIQLGVARWSPAAQTAHASASADVGRIKDQAFAMAGRGKPTTEVDVQRFIQAEFAAAGLETPDGPIVAVNAHSADPHYEPSDATPTPIQPGDWLLIDLWARRPGNANIFSDITWVGFIGREAPSRHQEVFAAVRAARDAVVDRAVAAWKAGERIQGWQLDQVARDVLVSAGYGQYIRHRTGHSLSPGDKVHGMGMNLDDLETHDTREMLPGLGFTIEPGLYLPEFGVRLEINVFVDPQRGPVVTSPVQHTIITTA